MEILYQKQDMLDFLPRLKSSLLEWQLVEIRLTKDSDAFLNINRVAELVHALFKDKEGKLYICNDHEILMLIRWGQNIPSTEITDSIKKKLPEGSCAVHIHPLTSDGLAKIELLITYKRPQGTSLSFADTRITRKENVILLADDDMYIRTLAKKGLTGKATVHEVENGNEILAAYKKYEPDMVFLDIHMPGKDGTEVLHDILASDPQAYVVMLSADSSVENIGYTLHEGAKGFLTKPFNKEKLLEFVHKCPTIT